ncbi:MAG: hypothetical protein LDL50_03650 [Chloroflexi bacterium]|nr:hypothetical protein [Chloroflexota bacterium]MCA2001645.1 hypothetical protein [Chloroflexota bacterium]
MNSKRTLLAASILLTAAAACVLPGAAAPAAPAVPLPTLTVDSAAIEMMVEATVAAAIAQTAEAAPTPAPAEVIVVSAPTATETPSATPSPAPSPTLTLTPPPTETNPSASEFIQQSDGSLLFKDNLAGYEIKLPAGWLAVRVNGKEYADALTLPEAGNEHIRQALLGIQNENPQILRLLALDIKPSDIQNEFVTEMRFSFEAGKALSTINPLADVQAIAGKIPSAVGAFRFEASAVTVTSASGGVQMGVIEAVSSFENAAGVNVPLYQNQAVFNTGKGLQTITLTTLGDLKPSLLPLFSSMLQTLKIASTQAP